MQVRGNRAINPSNEPKPKKRKSRVSIVPKASWLSDLAFSAGYYIGTNAPIPPPRTTLPIPAPSIPAPSIPAPSIPIPPSTKRFDLAIVPHSPSYEKFIGVIKLNKDHVLSMLFNADLKPRTSISSLRAEIAGKLAGMSRTPKSETHQHKSGQILECERWEPPIYVPLMNYSFLRSSQVPFGFVSVTLNRNDLSIGLEMENHRNLLPSDVASSVFGTKDQLNVLLQSNSSRLKPIPNWRVWTWSNAGKTYKAWAEFGGTIESHGTSDVLLRDNASQEIRVPKNSLSTADLNSILEGRYWASFNNQRRIFKGDNSITNTISFVIPGNPPRATGHEGNLGAKVDQDWRDKLRAATKWKPDVTKNIQAWQAFAGYIR